MSPDGAGDRAIPIDIESLVASRNHHPYVALRFGRQRGNLPAEQARQIGVNLIEAASAAELEAAIVADMVAAGATDDILAEMLTMLRYGRHLADRRALGDEPPPPAS